MRGDAKKFALERAAEFISTFGLPDELDGVTEPEPRFREQIYNWYKNTVGRTRRRQEGRPRSSKKASEEAQSSSHFTWPTNLATPTTVPYPQVNIPITTAKPAERLSPMPHPAPQYVTVAYQATSTLSVAGSASRPSPNTNHSHSIDISSIRDGFLNPAIDVPSLSSMIQTYTTSTPSRTPLAPVVDALFDATTIAQAAQPQSPPPAASYPASDPSYQLLHRFAEVCAYFPPSLAHANATGSLAGPRAVQMALRTASVWLPLDAHSAPSAQASMSHEMERMTLDRQRRKDYIQWARVHAAAIELGILGVSGDSASANGYVLGGARSFSEGMARDAVWQEDEVEWCAGMFVLRAIIRAGIRCGSGPRGEYEELLRIYEGRWKEIKDETRQALVTVSLVFPLSTDFRASSDRVGILAGGTIRSKG